MHLIIPALLMQIAQWQTVQQIGIHILSGDSGTVLISGS